MLQHVATSFPHESHVMGFTTCSLVVPAGPVKARSGGFWSGLTWAFRTASNSAQRVFFKNFETSTRLPWPAVTGAMGTTAPMPTAAATCAMPRSCEANESTFDLCDL